MTPAKLRKRIRGAYLPYAKGFCRYPDSARLELDIGTDYVDGTLELAASDFGRFDGSVRLRAHHRRAFNVLVRDLEGNGRNPGLAFERRGG